MDSLAEALTALIGLPTLIAAFEQRLGQVELAIRSRPPPPADSPHTGLLLTVEEAASFASVTPATVRTWISRGRLPASKPAGSRRWRVRRADLDAHLRGSGPDAHDVAAEAARLLGRGTR